MEQTKNNSTSKTVVKILLVIASLLISTSFFFPYVDFDRLTEGASIDELIWELEREDDFDEDTKERLINLLEQYSGDMDMSNADTVNLLRFMDAFEPAVLKVVYVIFYGPIVIGLVCALVSLLAKRSGVFAIPLMLSLASTGFYSLIRVLFDSEENMAGFGLDIVVMASVATFILSIVCMVVYKKKQTYQFAARYAQMQQGQFGMGYVQMSMGQQDTDYAKHAAQSPISYGSQDMGSFLNEINQNNNQQS
ncbi:MAG: hypothetical protein IJX86_11415 [Lachnospiraceae bacterium]|nr:hypothetical protein [Lachnospiraceae bacterium]